MRCVLLILCAWAIGLVGCSNRSGHEVVTACETYGSAGDCSQPSDSACAGGAGGLVYTVQADPAQAASPSGDGRRRERIDSGSETNWLELARSRTRDGQVAAQATGPAATSEPSTQSARRYVPWKERYGPAYPGNFWTSMGRDAKETPLVLWDDTKATFTNPVSLVSIALAGAAGISLASTGVDDNIADHYTKHGSQLNSFWDSVGDAGGNPGTHFAFAGAMYLYTLATNDARDYEVSKTLLSALMINGVTTEFLKVCVRTRSPNGDRWGWPSGHTSSVFTLATVMYEEYGPAVGVPLYAFAGYVGYERIDARNHDFSDVISGAMLGFAIGHAVTQNHKLRVAGMTLVPYVNPETDTMGVALVKSW